jgi:hypothetical protein
MGCGGSKSGKKVNKNRSGSIVKSVSKTSPGGAVQFTIQTA